jgi:hypothetical protein
VRELVKTQMLKPIIYCELKKTFCPYSTKSYCLNLRGCPYTLAKIQSFRRKPARKVIYNKEGRV